jgi:hypothetical protein
MRPGRRGVNREDRFMRSDVKLSTTFSTTQNAHQVGLLVTLEGDAPLRRTPINVARVLDRSGSMAHLADQVVKVADNQIAYLAKRSKELDQETRVTVYTFGNTTECLFYDKDVLRMPSLKGHYRIDGMNKVATGVKKL